MENYPEHSESAIIQNQCEAGWLIRIMSLVMKCLRSMYHKIVHNNNGTSDIV